MAVRSRNAVAQSGLIDQVLKPLAEVQLPEDVPDRLPAGQGRGTRVPVQREVAEGVARRVVVVIALGDQRADLRGVLRQFGPDRDRGRTTERISL